MTSGGRLSRNQKGKAAVTSSIPARDTSGDPLEEFESVHREAMMDTRSLDVPQRLLVSESARLHREEVRGAPTEAQVCTRDGRGGTGEAVPPINYVPTCHYPKESSRSFLLWHPSFCARRKSVVNLGRTFLRRVRLLAA